MKKSLVFILLFMMCIFLNGCADIGSQSFSLAYIYAATTIISFLLLLFCTHLPQRKNNWMLLLFASVFIVNIGYLCLSISTQLNEALLANRIAYFGSVFLPIAMLISILDVLSIRYSKWFSILLTLISVIVFFIAASPGYSTIYYQEVSIETINGICVLNKVYGPWHCIYLYYLLAYFSAMIAVIWYGSIKKKYVSNIHAIFLAVAVFVNIGVWFIEQITTIPFEFLSISYIISELFILGMHYMLQENDELRNYLHLLHQPPYFEQPQFVTSNETDHEIESTQIHIDTQLLAFYQSGLKELTKSEKAIYDLYVKGKSTNEILDALGIKLNTLKFHNKNIYSKLGVSSRRQLVEIHNYLVDQQN